MNLNRKLIPLREELLTDPEGRGYAGMTAAEAAADLNEQRYEELRRHFLTDRGLMAELGMTRAIAILDTLAGSAESTDTYIYEMLSDRAGGGIDVGLPMSQTMLDSMAPDLLTTAEATQIKALGIRKQSKAEQFGFKSVPGAWVTTCREA